MGTRGLCAIKYKGYYCKFYNHWDSYPNGLGKRIVNDLKYLDHDYLIELLESLEKRQYFPSDNRGERNKEYTSLTEILKTPILYPHLFDTVSPKNDLFIEYVYLIDVDTKTIEMIHNNKSVQYPLDNIPDYWAYKLESSTQDDTFMDREYVKMMTHYDAHLNNTK